MNKINSIKLSLTDLLGRDYTEIVCSASALLQDADKDQLQKIADEKVEFYPSAFQQRCENLLNFVGKNFHEPLKKSSQGAGTKSFDKALQKDMAPITGLGFIRAGENGKLYFTGKSEHYHATLGHNFPGFKLLENARKIGISNITHNNTRGHITRLLESELIRIANGISKGEQSKLDEILNSTSTRVLNRVINLETGSLAMEAALKMMLARFYKLDKTFDAPEYQGKIPVFVVMADNQGGKQANYHGTTILAQMIGRAHV